MKGLLFSQSMQHWNINYGVYLFKVELINKKIRTFVEILYK